MATKSAALRQNRAPDAGVHRPAGRPADSAKTPLGIVDRRQLLSRARRRQTRVLLVLSGAVLATALTIAAAGHAMLAASQIQTDGLQASLAGAVATQQNLQLQRAELGTPSRVLSIAEHRYKMVWPSNVTYLQPVNPGVSVEQAHEPRSRPATGSRSSNHHRRSH
ncbi:MAG: FtsB/FtsL family cell division protein [Acidimicrobiales bacterium]